MSERSSLVGDDEGRKPGCCTLRNIVLSIIFSAALVGLILVVTIFVPTYNTTRFSKSVRANNILNHLEHFLDIAYLPKNKGSRSVINGYDDSAQYVIDTLKKEAKCDISFQNYTVPIFQEFAETKIDHISPLEKFSYQFNVDFQHLRYGGSGVYDIRAKVFHVSNYGCNDADYAGIAAGEIALIQYPRGCTLVTIGQLCEKHNASAMIIYNDVDRTILTRARVLGEGWFPGDPLLTIPGLSMSHSAGSTLATLLESPQNNVELRIRSNTSITIVPTFNIYCVTKEGDPNSEIVAGAHLDSVPEGPGINDNGSGSSSLLEIVVQWYRRGVVPHNKVRFAWWGAEEIGLMGSRNYVKFLQENPDQYNKTALNLNFDMLASPNYVPQIHSVTIPGNPNAPASAINGSKVITKTFEDFFNASSKVFGYSAMGGGSDYYPFLMAGIPAGGLAAGAGAEKNMEQRTRFGGLAGAALDPCYHLPCDTVENIHKGALTDLAQAAAHAIYNLALEPNLRSFLSKPYPEKVDVPSYLIIEGEKI